ncbi:glutathione s-transferase [Aspergillus ustus]|uniref:Glutathione s-transferase n=1 Tax=Aspergillus ustus TaxID=40382 RepID=A0A0C1BVY4_ASPUT|nr:glutathione s-transferase [Aspergillus ustus]
MATQSNITLYTEGTPNGLKISIALEELGLSYKVREIALTQHEQKEPWFLEINPNGRIPALTDIDEDGNELHIFESGAILQYLVTRYDKDHRISYPVGSREDWEVTCWLMWQVSGLGPMQGQANHFALAHFFPLLGVETFPLPIPISAAPLTSLHVGYMRTGFAPENEKSNNTYALNRYVHETRRLYRVLDTALAKNASASTTSGQFYLVGDRCTIADIAVWPWVAAYKFSGLATIDEFPFVKSWLNKLLEERPGFERGRNVPKPHVHLAMNALSEAELDERAKYGVKWIQDAMARDAAA